MLCHRKPTSSHHNVRQLQSHPPTRQGGLCLLPKFFPHVTTEKGKQQTVQKLGSAGSWGCCSLVKCLDPTALSHQDCRKLLSERADKQLHILTLPSCTRLSHPGDRISPGGAILTSTLEAIPTYLKTNFPALLAPGCQGKHKLSLTTYPNP